MAYKILLMEENLHQLRLVVYPVIYSVFINPRWCKISSINRIRNHKMFVFPWWLILCWYLYFILLWRVSSRHQLASRKWETVAEDHSTHGILWLVNINLWSMIADLKCWREHSPEFFPYLQSYQSSRPWVLNLIYLVIPKNLSNGSKKPS